MSLTNVPSAEEAMGWNPQSLADYMRRLKLSSCDRVVLNCNISGAKFMHMKQRELEVFPRHCVPILANIQREMNKGAQRTTFDVKSMTEVHPVQVFSQNEEVWESDEFDSESDICEGTDYKEDGEDYICALTEEQIAENKHSGQAREGSCLPQAFAHTMKPPKPHKAPKPQDSCRERSANPPQPPSKRTDHISPRPFKAPTHYSDLKRNRMKLPQLPDSFQRPGPKLEGGVAMAPGSSSIRLPPPRAHQPTDAFNRMSKVTPAPPVPTQPAQENKSVLGWKQDLDPSWYGGQVSRHQAEATLREMNKDGAFVVRDSIKGSTEHPYTLMLLTQGKVYNIRIRKQGHFYLLGNGLWNTKSFPGVKEMINHHTHTPLLLIDATEQRSSEQAQCCLLHPAEL